MTLVVAARHSLCVFIDLKVAPFLLLNLTLSQVLFLLINEEVIWA